MLILNNGRFGLGCGAASGMRRLVALAADYANQRVQFGKPISQFGLIQEVGRFVGRGGGGGMIGYGRPPSLR